MAAEVRKACRISGGRPSGVVHARGRAAQSDQGSSADRADTAAKARTLIEGGDRMIRLVFTVVALLCSLSFATAQTAPSTAGPAPAAAIEDLVLANRILSDRGVLDAYGHISIRHLSNPNRYLMA